MNKGMKRNEFDSGYLSFYRDISDSFRSDSNQTWTNNKNIITLDVHSRH